MLSAILFVLLGIETDAHWLYYVLCVVYACLRVYVDHRQED